jgi:hypothetical protein
MKNFSSFITLILTGLMYYGASAQCEFGSHSTNWEDAWLSCETSANPNPDRGEGHWIMYDLGSPKALFQTHFWNYNVPGSTGQGVRNCFFDVSMDGSNWESWGNWEIAQAPGNNNYIGVEGPYLDGLVGRYLLISVQSNWNGDDCSGFAELKVNTEDTATDIKPLSALSFDVFPVPADQTLVLRHYEQEALQMEIYNLNGALVLKEQLYSSSSYLNVAGWNSGLYLLILRNNEGESSTRRFMVAH